MAADSLHRVLPCFLCGFLALSVNAQNLVVDPGFELGGASWQMSAAGGRSIVNTVAQTGTHSEQIVVAPQGFPRAVWQTVTVSADSSYDVSGWVQTDTMLNTTAHILVLWFNSATPPNNQTPGGYLRLDTVGALAGTTAWTKLQTTLTAPATALTAQVYLECSAVAGSSGTAWFDNLSFTLHPAVMPSLISAVASDNVVQQAGIDNDDYVLLTFDSAMDTFPVTALNVDTLFPLSHGHTWLSGFGSIGSAVWNPGRTKLLITLSVTISAPTIAVGDSISYMRSKVELTGSFDPVSGVRDRVASAPAGILRMVKTSESVYFSYPERVDLRIVDSQGRGIADLGSGTAFTWNYGTGAQRVHTGVYFAHVCSGDHLVAAKEIILR